MWIPKGTVQCTSTKKGLVCNNNNNDTCRSGKSGGVAGWDDGHAEKLYAKKCSSGDHVPGVSPFLPISCREKWLCSEK